MSHTSFRFFFLKAIFCTASANLPADVLCMRVVRWNVLKSLDLDRYMRECHLHYIVGMIRLAWLRRAKYRDKMLVIFTWLIGRDSHGQLKHADQCKYPSLMILHWICPPFSGYAGRTTYEGTPGVLLGPWEGLGYFSKLHMVRPLHFSPQTAVISAWRTRNYVWRIPT